MDASMDSDDHTTLPNLHQWHRTRYKSRSRSPSFSSQSSTDPSRPVTPQDPVFAHLHPESSRRPATAPRTLSVEGYWSDKSSAELDIPSKPHSSRSSLEQETRSRTDSYGQPTESFRHRTQTVTPATVRRVIQQDSDRMWIPFPGSGHCDSASTDSCSTFSGSDSASTYDEELGGIPARHPLRNRVNSKGSNLRFNDIDSRPSSPTKPLRVRAHTYRPDSTSVQSSPPRTSISLRLKPKKTYSHRGAMTLFKSLASSSNPEPQQPLEDVEFDWAEQRRQELERRAKLLEQEIDQARMATQTHAQWETPTESQRETNDGSAIGSTLLRPSSWELTPEELALRREQEKEEAKRFTYKDYIWVNRSYISAHTKTAVPYPLAYDNVNIQTDRNSHDLVKQLLSCRMSIHSDLSQRPPAFVLDLGCGDGTWVLEAAHCWKTTRFYGIDLQNLQPSRAQLIADHGEIADNIKFTYYNFLLDKLPYLDEKFDLVRMANLKWAIPEDKWDFVLQEVHRVLRRGGWVEIIDDEFPLGTSPHSMLSPEQRATHDMLETQFLDMLQARNLPLNTGSEFMSGKLDRWFSACHEEDFAISISKARPLSVEVQGQAPIQVILPSEGVSHKAAKLMGFGLESAHEKYRSSGSTRSRSRSGSVSSGVSYSSGASHTSGRDTEQVEDRVDGDQPGIAHDTNKRRIYQPLGLDVHPGRFIPFPPTELNAHATRKMQSILACKEAIRTHHLTKSLEFEALEVKEDLTPEERHRLDELSWEWNKQQSAFDDAFWDLETTMLKSVNLPQHSFDIDDDEDLPKSPNATPRPQPLRTASTLGRLHKGNDGNLPSPVTSIISPGDIMIGRVRVYSGWK